MAGARHAQDESERAFVVRLRPGAPAGVPVRQAYVVMGDPQFRIRESGGTYWITAKAGPKNDRDEIEAEIPTGGEAMLLAAPGGYIEKERRTAGRWEVDTFFGAFEGNLHIMEIERPGATPPDPPTWVEVVREVTHDPRFENTNLARLSTLGRFSVREARALIAEAYASDR